MSETAKKTAPKTNVTRWIRKKNEKGFQVPWTKELDAHIDRGTGEGDYVECDAEGNIRIDGRRLDVDEKPVAVAEIEPTNIDSTPKVDESEPELVPVSSMKVEIPTLSEEDELVVLAISEMVDEKKPEDFMPDGSPDLAALNSRVAGTTEETRTKMWAFYQAAKAKMSPAGA